MFQFKKLFQCFFLNTDEHALTQLSTLPCQRWNNVDKHTSAQFHFQPKFNVEITLVHRCWIDVVLPTLFQCCFVKIETTSLNVRRLNFQTRNSCHWVRIMKKEYENFPFSHKIILKENYIVMSLVNICHNYIG